MVNSSGPGMLIATIFSQISFASEKEILSEVAPYALSHYQLNHAFQSKQAFNLNNDLKKMYDMVTNTTIGIHNDLSWLEEGRSAIRVRESKTIAATNTLQRFFKREQKKNQNNLPAEFRKMRQLIETHIAKIEADLSGIFGFYRKHARYKKIAALKSILGHFHDQSFNVNEFNQALKSYQTNEVAAAFGKSATKELIDGLTLLCRRAKALSLVDEAGQLRASL